MQTGQNLESPSPNPSYSAASKNKQFLKSSRDIGASRLSTMKSDDHQELWLPKRSRYVGASGLTTMKSDEHGFKRLCKGNSVLCSINKNDTNEYRVKPTYIDLTINDGMEKYDPSCKEYSSSPLVDSDESDHVWTIVDDDMEKYGDSSAPPLVDTDESMHDGSRKSPEDSKLYNADDSVDSLNSSNLDKYDTELEKALRLLISKGHNCVARSSISSDSLRAERSSKARDILTMLFSDGKYYPRHVPIGPDFQAEIPEWTGPINRKNLYNGDSSKLLGIQIWPIKGMHCEGTNVKGIGKGRRDSCCSCVSPRSVSCVKHHIDEASFRLQAEIGSAFQIWKFDEMGELASKSWTSKEQKTFESLVRKYPPSSEACFWKPALKRFPDKCRKSVVSYYYNVYIPRRMSLETRGTIDEIDSDED